MENFDCSAKFFCVPMVISKITSVSIGVSAWVRRLMTAATVGFCRLRARYLKQYQKLAVLSWNIRENLR